MTSMDAFPWSDRYLLGYSKMDDTHREFVELLGALQVSRGEQVLICLDAFIAHARAHFAQEDEWMRTTGFPAGECHMDEHAAVLNSLAEVRDAVAQGHTYVAHDVAAALAEWFPGHTDYLDSALAQWMSKRQFGGAPVVLKKNPATAAAADAQHAA